MVAGATYYCAYYNGHSHCVWWQQCHCPIHLHLVLKMKFNRKHIETIIVLTIALLVTGWFTKKQSWYWVAAIFAMASLALPPLAKYIHIAWMKLAEAIGYVMNKVLLSIVFIIVVIPFGLLSRLTGKNSIRLKKGGDTYFKTRNHTYTKADLENMW
jgi:hypothetical protein